MSLIVYKHIFRLTLAGKNSILGTQGLNIAREGFATAPYTHAPVMPEETVSGLNIKPGGVYVDGTLGGAGHALLIAEKLTDGMLVGIDRDGDAVCYAKERLRSYEKNCKIIRGNFSGLPGILHVLGIPRVDGVLLDLGVSSYQLDTPERGFSYRYDARLDMRMDDRDGLTAHDVVNRYTEQKLVEIMFSYGEERYAKRIARALVNERQKAPVETTGQLTNIITRAVPRKAALTDGHSVRRVYQAVRIEVNNELSPLNQALRDITGLLNPGGRLCVITFHSLEDRIVKHCFKNLANPCDCPRDLPVCVCGRKPMLHIVTRKAVTPGEAEINQNPRSHSAKLRVAERTNNHVQ